MKRIETFEKAMQEDTNLTELGINPTLFRAYLVSKDANRELIDFGDVIWDREVPAICEALRDNDVSEFTISSTFSSLIPTLAVFEENGYRVAGLTKTKPTITGWGAKVPDDLPALLMRKA